MQGCEFQNRAIVMFPSKSFLGKHVEIGEAINSSEKSLTLKREVVFECDTDKNFSI
jgi:hypothetical protein